MKSYILIAVILIFASCSSKKKEKPDRIYQNSPTYSSGAESQDDEEKYSDGTWCADVEYYNPNTGTRNTYELDVEVESGELIQINWPNGGWLDETHFIAEDISSGECSFTSDRGYRYTITLNDKGGCSSSDGYRLQRDMQEDIKKSICPRCGNEKESYDDRCDDCQSKIETCPKCYGHKFEWERICSSCVDEIQNQEDN